jgi:hypothetical protein
VKRAFELAPDCSTIDEIRARLKKEGLENVLEHLQGSGIQKELRSRLRAPRLAATSTSSEQGS